MRKTARNPYQSNHQSIITALLMTLDSATFVHQHILSLLTLQWVEIRPQIFIRILGLILNSYQLTLLYAPNTGYIAPIPITFSEFVDINIVLHL